MHSVVAVRPGNVRTRETTCVCDNCFQENGFCDNTPCLWTLYCMAKPLERGIQSVTTNTDQKECENQDAENIEKEGDFENRDSVEYKAKQQMETDNIKESEFVVIVYNAKCYIGQVTEGDDEDNEVEVSCMEECGKVHGRYKWPRNIDKIWLNRKDILKVINAPTPTGRTKRIFSVDDDTAAFMRGVGYTSD